jgi:hypothetical protein
MPNWCSSDLIVKGKTTDLAAFSVKVCSPRPLVTVKKEVLDRLTGQEEEKESFLDANKIIPYPEEYAKADRANAEAARKEKQPFTDSVPDGYNHGGYEWCIANWGTKWGFCDVEREVRPRSIIFTFQTAWSPPEPLIRKLGEMFPKLEFTLKYYECGGGFSGKLHIKDGEINEEYNDNYRGNRGG